MEREKSKKKLNRAMSAITVIICIIAAVVFATAADAAYAGNYDDISAFNDTVGGKSINGVRISQNSEILNYALDMWEKVNNSEWKYTGSNIDGNVSEIDSSNSSTVFIKGKSEPRFGIDLNVIKNKLPRNGSVIVKKYRKGKLIYKRAEFTYQTENENEVEDSISLLKQAAKGISRLELPSTDYNFDSVSYIYDIYDAAVIGQSGDIYTALDDCRIISDGYAYYGAEGEYIIKELPVAEHNAKTGYIYNFDGWYTQEGYKLCAGDAIDIRTTIHPQWDISRISYNVNYIDILGNEPSGQVLGTSTSPIYCDDEASGSDIGNDKSVGAYYDGLYYTDCTSVTVQGDCDVYRYFRPALYNINFNGNMSTSGETASITNCTYGDTYNLTENGFKRNGTVTLDLNAEDAVCTTKNIDIEYEFKGWSETSDGNVIYEDCASVSNLCSADGEKQLYAVWNGGSIEINAIPERNGYRFDGWTKDKSATSGSTLFNVSDSNDCTLYAVWTKNADNNGNTDNSGNTDNNGSADNSGNTNNSGSTDNNGSINNNGTGTTDGNTSSSNENSSNGNNTDKNNSIETIDKDNKDKVDSNNIDKDNKDKIDSNNTDKDNKDKVDSNSTDKDNKDKVDSNSTNKNNSSSSGNGGSTSSNSSTNSGSSISSGSNNNKTNTNNKNNGNSGTIGTTGNQKPPAKNQGIGNQNAVTTSGSSITNTTENINNSDTNINNKPVIDDNIIKQTPDINIDNKKENKKDFVSKNTPVYPKIGKNYKKSGIIYKIIKSNKKKRTVKVLKAVKTITEAKIPSNIKIKSYKYKVISIGKKAFIKCSKLKKAVIGKNIKSIGKKAFYKNKELGNIKIKSKKLKSIGKSAFKRIKPNCAVKIVGSKKYAQKVFEMMNK